MEWSLSGSRLTPLVDAAAARARPRPPGVDGRLAPYVYAMPAELADGLRVGDVSQAGFDTTSVVRLVNRVVDGTYPDVHGILVYRAGRIVECATGKPLLAFAQENLFTPLGIRASDVQWNFTLSSSC